MGTEYESNLQDLLNVPPRSLMEVNTNGTRMLSSFCDRLCTPDQQQGSESLAKQLFSLFDFLLEKGCAFYIIDYVNEVCRDPRCTSSNPIEAYVLEGTAVLDWCETVLSSIKAIISRSFSSLKQKINICKQTMRAEGIELILETLNGMVGYRDKGSNALAEAEEISKGLHVLLWCVGSDIMNLEPKGPNHTSYEEWQKVHRSNPQLRELYCSELSIGLGLSSNDYPYVSVEAALQTLFFDARLPLGKDAWRAKSMLFGYFLLNARFVSALERFQHHPFSLSVAEVALTEGYVYFDRYRVDRSNEVLLKKGLERFKLSMPAVPFSLLDSLVQMGFSDVALHIWGGQQSLRKRADVLQIRTMVKARLRRDEIAFALDVAREHYQQLSGEEMSNAIEVLMIEILEWGVLFDRMDKVLMLPFNREEEDVFILWAKRNWEDDRCSVCMPVYYLARSRQLDAIRVIALAEKEGKIERSTGQIHDAWVRVQAAVHDSLKYLPQFMKEEIATIEASGFGDPSPTDDNVGSRNQGESSMLECWNTQPGHFSVATSTVPPVEMPEPNAGFQIGQSEGAGKRKHSTAFGLTLKRMR